MELVAGDISAVRAAAVARESSGTISQAIMIAAGALMIDAVTSCPAASSITGLKIDT